MPGNNARALEKGSELNADAIVMDLEDSVAPNQKEEARLNIQRALSTHDYADRITVVRVNGLHSHFIDDDLQCVAAAKPQAVLLPKVEKPDDVEAFSDRLNSLSLDTIKIWLMLETPKAVVNAGAIAAMSEPCSGLSTVCIGNNDLARESGMEVSKDRTSLLPWLMTLVAAAKAFGLDILDGVYNDFSDLQGFASECAEAKRIGMTGKTLIHPTQIAAANDAFSPSAASVKEAQEVVSAFASYGKEVPGVINHNGRMLELLHLDMAKRTLEIAELCKVQR